MSDLLPVEVAESAFEIDPVGYMATVLHRAKSWLEEAQNIDDVRNTKAIAVGYESVLREKEMAFDAQLAATEIIRRCERRVGELVRQGQAEGTIKARGDGVFDRGDRYYPDATVKKESPHFVMGVKASSDLISDSYAMADADPDTFEQALSEAKAEGNLSRANVVRKVKGEPAPASRNEWHHKKRHIDSARIISETVMALEGACMCLDLVDFAGIDPLEKLEWTQSLKESLRTLNRFMRELNK